MSDVTQTASFRLALALQDAGAPEVLIVRAQAGYYGDYTSPLATPIMELVKDLRSVGLEDVAQRAIEGDFDGD